MKKTAHRVLGSVVLGGLAAAAAAQEKSHDPLALAREHAAAQNQRVLLALTGGDEPVEAALGEAVGGALRELLRDEYRIVALPASSVPGRAVRERLRLADLAAPVVAVLDTDDRVLGSLGARELLAGDALALDRLQGLLQQHRCAPLDARQVLTDGVAAAAESRRHAFVYLSAPW